MEFRTKAVGGSFVRAAVLAMALGSLLPLLGCSSASVVPGVQVGSTDAALSVASGLSAPGLAVGTDSVTLVWGKPSDHADVAGYLVYENGNLLSSADDNTASPAEAHLEAFYADQSNSNAERASMHSYVITGLEPGTAYTFSVTAVGSHGDEVAVGDPVSVTTRSDTNVLDVTSYGAAGDGTTPDTEAIQQAIDACPDGGTVLLPQGRTFLSGPLLLKGDMTFEVNGTLLASPSASDYATTAGSSKARPLLSNESDGQADQDIRVIGTGTIDGNGWRSSGTDDQGFPAFMKGDDKTVDAKGVLAAAECEWARSNLGLDDTQAYAWRSNIISMQDVSGLYVGGGLTITDPAQHVLTMSGCSDATLDRLTVESYDCNNGDGVDFSNGDGLTVVNCAFDTGDDSIDLNAGYGEEGEAGQPVEDVWVFDDYFGHGHAAVAAGSGTAAGIERVLVEDDVIVGGASGLRCKTSEGTGGGAHDIVFRDCALRDITEEEGEPFVFTSLYPRKKGVTAASDGPTFESITVEDCTVDTSSGNAILVAGLPSAYHRGLLFRNVSFSGTKAASLTYLEDSTFSNVTSDLGGTFFGTSDTRGLSIVGTTG